VRSIAAALISRYPRSFAYVVNGSSQLPERTLRRWIGGWRRREIVAGALVRRGRTVRALVVERLAVAAAQPRVRHS
jgi:hypothetical protein